jgi:hypothetical protein
MRKSLAEWKTKVQRKCYACGGSRRSDARSSPKCEVCGGIGLATLPDSIKNERIFDLTLTNDSPNLTIAIGGDHDLMHAIGRTNNPRFLMERPYSPDDAWLLTVDPVGDLASDFPSLPRPVDAEIETFLGMPLGDSARGLIHALPTGRYALVRSSRPLVPKARILLGNEYVPAPPNALVLRETDDFYAVAFGACSDLKPNTTGLFVGVALLAYVGNDVMDGIWLFEFSGEMEPAVAPGEIVMVLPIEGPLVIDALAGFRKDTSEVKQHWADDRAATFIHWCAGG